jgi:ketosteroid isomerase-like protein
VDLDDREAIRQVLYRHCYCVDEVDADAWATMFTEDGSFAILSAPAGMRFDPVVGRAALREFASNMFPLAAGMHTSANEMITINGDEATVTSYCVALRDASPNPLVATAARFEDLLRKVDGEWLIYSRRVSLRMITQ